MTVNYRLGPWGELSLDSGRISGNQGLRDQVQGDKGPLTRYQVQGLWDNVQGLRDQLHKMHFFFFFNLSLRFLPCSGFRRTLFIWEATLRRLLFGERVLEHGGLFYLVFSFIITLVIISITIWSHLKYKSTKEGHKRTEDHEDNAAAPQACQSKRLIMMLIFVMFLRNRMTHHSQSLKMRVSKML